MLPGSDAGSPHELVTAWSQQAGPLQHVLVSRHGLVACLAPASVLLLEGASALRQKRQLQGPTGDLRVAAFNSSGSQLIAGGADGFITWWSLETGQELSSTQFSRDQGGGQAGSSPVSALSCSHGTHLVAAAAGRLICIFGPGGEHLHSLPQMDRPVMGLAWLDGARLAAAVGARVLTWRIGTDSCTSGLAQETAPSSDIVGMSCSPSGKHLAAECANSMVQVWDSASLGTVGHAADASASGRKPLLLGDRGDAPVTGVSWHSSSRFLAASCRGEVTIWDIESTSGSAVVRLSIDSECTAVSAAFQAQGTLLAVATDTGRVALFSTAHLPSRAPSDSFRSVGSALLPAARPGQAVRLIWHPSGLLLAARDTGELVCYDATGLEVKKVAHITREPSPAVGAPLQNGHRHAGPRTSTTRVSASGAVSPEQQHQPPQRSRSSGGPSRESGAKGGSSGNHSSSSAPPPATSSSSGAGGADGWDGPAVASLSLDCSPAGSNDAHARNGGGGAASGVGGADAGAVALPPRAPAEARVSVGRQRSNSKQQQGGDGGGGNRKSAPPQQLQQQLQQQQQQQQQQQHMESQVQQALQVQQAQQAPTAPPGWGVMPMPPWTVPYMPYGQVPGVPGMPYMVAPSPGMPYPYMPVMPPGAAPPPGYMFPPPVPGLPNGLGQPGSVPGAMPMYMYPPAAALPGAPPWSSTGLPTGYAPHQWPPYGYYGQQPPPPAPSPSSSPRVSRSSAPARTSILHPAAAPTANGGAAAASAAPGPAAAGAAPKPRRTTIASSSSEGPRRFAAQNVNEEEGSAEQGNGGHHHHQQQHRMGRPGSSGTTSTSGTCGTAPRGSLGSSGVRAASSSGTGSEARSRHLATLYIGNLSPTVEESSLYASFIQFGQITNVQIIRETSTGLSRGYGFVSFKHPPSATMALQHMNGVNLMGPFQGRAIKVSRYTKANFKQLPDAPAWQPQQPLAPQQ